MFPWRNAPFPFLFQNPNEDTEWNDILRKKGILPPKEKLKEQEQAKEEEELRILQQQSIGEFGGGQTVAN